MLVDEIGDLHVDLPGQHHFHNFHRRLVRHSHAMPELGLDPQPTQHFVDLGAATVDDDWIDPDVL